MANDFSAPLLRSETSRRLLFTAGVLLAYRLGCHIPLPGIDAGVLAGLKGVLKPETLSLFGLGVTPIFSVLFIFEFIKLIVPPLSRWEAANPINARRLNRIVYILALAMAGFQARGVAHALYGIRGLVDGPGWEIPIALTLVAGVALLGWLGDRVTAHGLGHGLWLLWITPTLAQLPAVAAGSVELAQRGAVNPNVLTGVVVFMAVSAALIVVTSNAGASSENRVSGARFAAVWPPLLAATISGFAVALLPIQAGGAADLLSIAALIALFNALQSWGGAAPTGPALWTLVAVQIFVCAGGEFLTHAFTLPFPVNGSWLIVIVITAISCLRVSEKTAENAIPA
jgi:preprotein translocase subunit SecY